MTKPANAIVTGSAEKSSHLPGIVAVVHVKVLAVASRIFGLADGTYAILFRQFGLVGAVLDAVGPAQVHIMGLLRVLLLPPFAAFSVAGRVFVSAGSHRRHRAGPAVELKAIRVRPVGAEGFNWFDRLALGAAPAARLLSLHATCRKSGLYPGALLRGLARFAVGVQSVLLLVVRRKFARLFGLFADQAGLHRGFLSGSCYT